MACRRRVRSPARSSLQGVDVEDALVARKVVGSRSDSCLRPHRSRSRDCGRLPMMPDSAVLCSLHQRFVRTRSSGTCVPRTNSRCWQDDGSPTCRCASLRALALIRSVTRDTSTTTPTKPEVKPVGKDGLRRWHRSDVSGCRPRCAGGRSRKETTWSCSLEPVSPVARRWRPGCYCWSDGDDPQVSLHLRRRGRFELAVEVGP